MNSTVLFDLPQQEIATEIRTRLLGCENARIVTGFLTPSGIGALAPPIRARPTILKKFVVGAATYPGFKGLDQLIAWGVPPDRLRVHLGHTRPSGTPNNPIVRHHPMLHSKVYYMELPGRKACAFVGSHNVTSFALQGLNGEAAVMLEGDVGDPQFQRIRAHIDEAARQAVVYSPTMKEAFAWWTREFIDGLRSEIGIPTDWTTIRTILIFAKAAAGDRLKSGEQLYFELPDGIAIDSLKCEVHLFLFSNLPPDPLVALQQLADAQAHYTLKLLGAENRQGNIELKAQWRIDSQPTPTLRKVPSGLYRPGTTTGLQQLRAEVSNLLVIPYEYLFDREKRAWWPVFSRREELFLDGAADERFPIVDTNVRSAPNQGWKLVSGLEKGDGPAPEKDALALERAKPESGSFVLVSLRRRAIRR